MKRLLYALLFLIASCNLTAQIITLDLNNTNIELNERGYWARTYSNDHPSLDFGLFSFTHLINGGGGTDVGGGMSYWDGFTYCTNGDTIDYGAFGTSDGWVANQWGCIAGGGIKTNDSGEILKDTQDSQGAQGAQGAQEKVAVEKGIPYLVAYWGYWIEMMEGGSPCLKVTFNDNASYEAVGVYIANHPWPFYGNVHGDGFASPFDEDDYFRLYIHGLNEFGEDVGNPVMHTLAEYKDGELKQSSNWEWVDLSSLGTVSGFFFTMETTDADYTYGPNSAVYFCMDKLQVRTLNSEGNTPPSRPSNLQVTPTETTLALSWNVSSDDVKVAGYNVYLNNEHIATTDTTFYLFENLTPATSYQLSVEAFDDESALSDRAGVNAATTDETPPTMPAQLGGIPTETTIALTWDASTDNVAVTGYNVYLNGEREKRVTVTAYILTLLDPSTTYFVEVEALDGAGNKSERAAISLSTLTNASIQDNATGNKFNVYPNPFTGKIFIEANQDGVVEIYNVNGTKMHTTTVSSGTNIINTPRLPKGVYIIKYQDSIIKVIK